MRKLTVYGTIAAMIAVLVLGAVVFSTAPRVEANPGTQWNATYYNSPDLSGAAALTRIDDKIDFNWASGSPGAGVNADNFSARWTKTVNFPNAGRWTFRVGADDGIRMWIDVTQIVNEWHGNPEGYRTYEVSLDGLTAGNHDLKVEYFEATGNAGIKVEWWYGGSGGGGTGTGSGTVYGPANWNASYFNNVDLSGGAALTRTDGDINFNWATGSPGTGVNADNFSARWTTTFNFPAPGVWRFKVGADDGVRMWIDVTQIVNEWHGNPEGFRSYEVEVAALSAGNHELKVEYFEATGNAGVQVRWWQGGASGTPGAPAPTPLPTKIPPATVVAAVTGDNVNVRSGPGEGNPVIAQIDYPNNYRVLGGVADLSWLLIDLRDGRQGWVSNEWVWLFAKEAEKNEDTTGGGQPDFVDDIPRIDIAVAPPAVPSSDIPPTILLGTATDTVNLRNGPSLYAADIIGAVPQGATFDVQARTRNGAWYLISYRSIRGWVNASFVTLSGGGPADLVVSAEVVPNPPAGQVFVPQATQGVFVTVRGRANSNLNLRDAASLGGDEIGTVPFEAEFVIQGRNTNGAWYLITFEGTPGWVNASYVTLIEGRVTDLPIR